ncbi:MAG: hypothetical protein AAF228_03550 [Pseudomonadota bacterium]
MTETTNLYSHIYLHMPEEIKQGGYAPWAEQCRKEATLSEDRVFKSNVELTLEVSTRFEGCLLTLGLWVEKWLRDCNVLSKQSRILAVQIEHTQNCSDISVIIFNIDHLNETKDAA